MLAAELSHSHAFAEPPREERFDFEIRASRLGPAMGAFIDATGVQLLYPFDLAEETGLNPVVGRYTIREALDVMFEGTKFSASLTERGTVMVSRMSAEQSLDETKNNETSQQELPTGGAAKILQRTGSAQDADGNAASRDRIIVKGSRLIFYGLQTPVPVAVVETDAFQDITPSNIPDAVNKLPQIANSDNQITGATFQAGTSLTGNFLNLRSLGTDRLLVLFDGQRLVPTNRTNAVDINMLPQLLVSRVDVVTGGVSAIYGSDAVTGAVNFVLDDKFEGVKAIAQAGLSDQGDNFSQRYAAAFGASIGARAHILASFNHYDSNGIGSLYDREWAHDRPSFTGSGAEQNPIRLTPNPRWNGITDGGLIVGGLLDGMKFEPNGALTPFEHGIPSGRSTIETGGDGVKFGSENGAVPLSAPLKTDRAFARATFDLSDSVEFYAQGMYGKSRIFADTVPANNRAATRSRRLTIFTDNPYVPEDVSEALTASGEDNFVLSRMFNDMPPMTQEVKTRFYMASAGLRGDIEDLWTWEANYAYGRSRYDLAANEFDSRNLYAAVDAVRDPDTGNIVCGVTLTKPGYLPDCAPLNLIGEGNWSEAAYDFVRRDSTYRIINETTYVNFYMQGELFDLPAGPAILGIGGEYRTHKLKQTSNSDPFFLDDPMVRAEYFEGIRGVSPSARLFMVTNIGGASGTQKVKEINGALLAPLIGDKPLVQNFSLNMAGRFTDYKTSGSVWTYKFGGSWTPMDGVRFRASHSRDIRAPSLFDLFAQGNVQQAGFIDPHTNLDSVISTSTGGNPDINPEFGKTTAIGMVLSPAAFPGLSFVVDAYRIKINGAIRTSNAEDQAVLCEASNGADPVCGLISRPFPFSNTSPENYPTVINIMPLNLARLETQGIDFELSYTMLLDNMLPSVGGTLSLQAFTTYLDKYDTQGNETAAIVERAGKQDIGGLPKWRGLLRQTYNNGPFTASFAEHFTGSYFQGTTEIYEPGLGKAPNRTYVDMNLAYRLGSEEQIEVFFNIQNLFDVDPPLTNESGSGANLVAPTDKSFYDVRGRFFTTGVRVEF